METHDLSLSERERFLLDALTSDSSARSRRRARIVIAWADGQNARTIAHFLNARPNRVEQLVQQFQEKRLAIFSAAARRRVENSPPPHANRADSLTSQCSMQDAARFILKQQFSKFKKTEADVARRVVEIAATTMPSVSADTVGGVGAAENGQAVHDMRVALRRMNSAFRLFKPYLPNKRVKKLRGVMEELRDTLGAARNLDVLSEHLETYCEKLSSEDSAQLARVLEAWKRERSELQGTLIKLLDSGEYKAWRDRMDAFLDDDAGDDSPRIAEALPPLLWKQYGAVRAYEVGLDGASPERLHALRIDVKRLRYTLEFFEDAFETKPASLIEPLVKLQDHLGRVQDAVVGAQALTDFIGAEGDRAKKAGESIPEFRAIAAYHAFLLRRIDGLGERLREGWSPVVGLRYRRGLGRAAAGL